jgi:hypothetical protein
LHETDKVIIRRVVRMRLVFIIMDYIVFLYFKKVYGHKQNGVLHYAHYPD